MKKRTILGTVLFVVLVLQAQTVFAADYYNDFRKELNQNNLRNIKRLLERRAKQMDLNACMRDTIKSSSYTSTKGFNKANCIDVIRLLIRYGADINSQYVWYGYDGDRFEDGYPLENAVEQKHSIAVIQFLLDSGANPNMSSSYSNDNRKPTPVRRAYSNKDMPVVNLLLERGARGADILPSAGSRGDNEMIRMLIARGVSIRSEQGAEALRWAAESSQFDTIKLLVENGVNVNARSNDNSKTIQEFIPLGATAASIAYDKGEMDIYDYLKANGARDFEPRQVAQQAPPAAPSSTTNVYVQPSAPAPAAPSEPPRNIGKEIAEAFMSPLDSGTYGASGTTAKMRFTSIGKSGVITYTTREGKNGTGTYSINGNSMTVQMEGYTFVYNITSKTSFSNRNESWVRTGF